MLIYCRTVRARLYFGYRCAEGGLETVKSTTRLCAPRHKRRIKRYGSTISRSIRWIPIRNTKSASLRSVWIARAKSWLLSIRFAVRKSVLFRLAALRYMR